MKFLLHLLILGIIPIVLVSSTDSNIGTIPAHISMLLPPHPILLDISIDAIKASNLDISVLNLRSSDTLTGKTNKDGLYIIELGNFDTGYAMNDVIEVTLFRNYENKSFNVTVMDSITQSFSINLDWLKNVDETIEDEYITTEKLDKLFKHYNEHYNDKIINYINRSQNEAEQNADERIISERKISIEIAVLISIISLISSLVITKYYSIK